MNDIIAHIDTLLSYNQERAFDYICGRPTLKTYHNQLVMNYGAEVLYNEMRTRLMSLRSALISLNFRE